MPNCGVESRLNDRNGRLCDIRKINRNASHRLQSLRENSFQIKGPKLFNSSPRDVRNLTKCSVNEFKYKLDEFLSKILDQPKTPDLVPEAIK